MTNEAMEIVWLLWLISVHPEADVVIYIAVYLLNHPPSALVSCG